MADRATTGVTVCDAERLYFSKCRLRSEEYFIERAVPETLQRPQEQLMLS